MMMLDIGLAALGGLLLGSFGNVVVHRIPRGESIVHPPSSCGSCSKEIAAYDNIPVLSWLVLGGKCRHCKAPIALRYPALEVGMALLFALTTATVDSGPRLILLLPEVFLFTCLAVIDLEHRRLPDVLTIPAGVYGVVAAAAVAAIEGDPQILLLALASGAAAFVALLVIALLAPGGMGMGDVKLAPALGLVLGHFPRGGARAFLGFLLAFVIGTVVGLITLLIKGGNRKTSLPFGPSLIAGTLISVWWGDRLVELWLG